MKRSQRWVGRLAGVMLVGWLGLSSAAVGADDQAMPMTLDLRQALALAASQNPAVLAAEFEAQGAIARVDQARAPFWPTLAVTGAVDRTTLNVVTPAAASPVLEFPDPIGSIVVGNPDRDLDGFTRYSAGIALEYVLLDFGQRSETLAGARRERDAFASRRATAANEQVREAGIMYFEVLRLEGLVGVRREAVARKTEAVDLAQRLERAGQVTVGDQARAEADLARARVELLRVENDLENHRLWLRKALGFDNGPVDFQLDPSSRVQTPAQWLNGLEDQSALLDHPSATAQEALTESREALVRARLAERFPTLALVANYTVQRFASGGGSAPNYSVGLQLRWDLADGGARRAQTAEARALAAAERERLRETRQTLLTRLNEAQLAVRETTARIELAEQALTAAATDLRLAQGGYREGLRTFYDLSLAETSFQEMAEQLVSAEFERQQALLTLYWAVGRLDADIAVRG
ncbi:MAG: TolC family protein [Thioalkalivibrionaceae bacterium]